MERIARRDLLDFIRTHNIGLPLDRRNQVLDRIIEKTEGRYEQTIDELRNLIDLAWDVGEDEREESDAALEKKYDY